MWKCLLIRRPEESLLPLHPDLSWTSRTSAVEALDLARNQRFDAIVILGTTDVLSPLDWFRLFRTTEANKVFATEMPLFWIQRDSELSLMESETSAIEDLRLQVLRTDTQTTADSLGESLAIELSLQALSAPPERSETAYSLGDLLLNYRTLHAEVGQAKVRLTRVEFDLLLCLMKNASKNVTREEIRKFVWKEKADHTRDRTVDVHIRALRKKIPQISDKILSIYGSGYRFTD